MDTVADKIGEDYKDFKLKRDNNEQDKECEHCVYGKGVCVFISAPTGSGKTHFILNVWMKYAANKNLKVLYLVNRTILKDQLSKEIKDMGPKISSCIDVKLYQDIESGLKSGEREQGKYEKGLYTYKNMRKSYRKYLDYDCVVCDECHYFLTDSNYNTDTGLSFRWIQECFAHKIRFFMSATIEDIQAYVEEYDFKRVCTSQKFNQNFKYWRLDGQEYKNKPYREFMENLYGKTEYHCFAIPKNYDYLDIEIINSKDDIADFITQSGKNEKWLIFVDSINTGKNWKKNWKKRVLCLFTLKINGLKKFQKT